MQLSTLMIEDNELVRQNLVTVPEYKDLRWVGPGEIHMYIGHDLESRTFLRSNVMVEAFGIGLSFQDERK